RAVAPVLARAMGRAAAAMVAGVPVAEALAAARAEVLAGGYREVEYLELCDAGDLVPMTRLDRPARLLAAAWLGEVRLIDNIAVGVAA
ncbi:MAG: pantoate--beta-alanine ligase, partial [Paracoccaceae bacterium]|nr:pantoate--beta-alanine ligase [Paracoccaceae bacterium]